MKKILFLTLLFLIVGCSTPEIHIPSFHLGGNTDSKTKENNKTKVKTKDLQDVPKIETTGGFFSIFGNKPKVRNEYFTGGKLRSKFVMNDHTGESGLLYKYGYNGKITSTVHIKHGLKNGLETLFNEKGSVMKRTPYVNGIKEGIVEVYYPDGKILAQISYSNNKRHGRASKYNKDGSTNEEVHYMHGNVVLNAMDNDTLLIPVID